MQYRPDIDGLRALAVLPVLLFHAGVTGFSGGFVGVDIFFVISGFLITGIIDRELGAGSFSILRFYERRVRRIIPALVVVIAVCCVVAPLVMLPEDLRTFGRSAVAALASASNVNFMLETDYFQSQAALKPLLHTWSLGVEEQFYIVFPVFLLLISRWSRKALLPSIWLAFVLSLAFCIYMTSVKPAWAFFLSPARAWELLVGSVLALGAIPTVRHRLSRELVSGTGLGMIFAAIVLFDSRTPFPGGAALIPCIGAGLLIHCAPGTWVGKFLIQVPLVFMGLISYSLYLWHWPILAFAHYVLIRDLTTIEAVTLLVFATALATATWHWVERPFREKLVLPTRAKLFGGALATLSSVAAVAMIMYLSQGLPQRIPHDVMIAAAGSKDVTSYRDRCLSLPVDELLAGHTCRFGEPVRATALLWGDSHADSISPVIADVATAAGIGVINGSHTSCPPLLGVDVEGRYSSDCKRWNEGVADIAASRDIRTVFLVSRWAAYAHGKGYGPDADIRLSLGANNRSAMLEGLNNTLRALRGKRVYLVLSAPEILYDVPSALARKTLYEADIALEPSRAQYLRRQAIIAPDLVRMAARYHATIIDPSTVLCQDRCRVANQLHPLYIDNHHLSTAGARMLRPLFRGTFGNESGR